VELAPARGERPGLRDGLEDFELPEIQLRAQDCRNG
jgi:hypothetical protein